MTLTTKAPLFSSLTIALALALVGCEASGDADADTDDTMPMEIELPEACVGFEDVLRLDMPRYGEPAEDVCGTEGAPLGTFGTEGSLNAPWVCVGDLDSRTHRDLIGRDASGGAPSTYFGMYTYDNAEGETSYIGAMVTNHGFTWVSKCVASSAKSGDSSLENEDREAGDRMCEGIPVSVGSPADPGQVVFDSGDGPCSLRLHLVSGFPE